MPLITLSEHHEFKQNFLNSSERQNNCPVWLAYASKITPEQLDHFLSSHSQTLCDAWKIGDYDALLFNGEITAELKKALIENQWDHVDLKKVPSLEDVGLVVMDMDSTAIQIECIDEIAKLAGVGDEVSHITERAMQGELDFEQSLRARVALLKGADAAILEQVKSTLPLMPELKTLVDTLKHHGWKVAIASGGFTYFSDHLKETLGLDHAYANQLEIVDGKLTGELLGEIISAQTKADVLNQLASDHGIAKGQTIAIGDGANDLPMIHAAGLGVAFHAKPTVNQQADICIRYGYLGALLCMLYALKHPC